MRPHSSLQLSFDQTALRFVLDPFKRVGLLFKSENRLDLTTMPEQADGASFPDGVSTEEELIFWLEVHQLPYL